MQVVLDQGQNIFSDKKSKKVGCAKIFLNLCTKWHAEFSATQNVEVCAFWLYMLGFLFKTSWDHNTLSETFKMMYTHHAHNYNPLKFSFTCAFIFVLKHPGNLGAHTISMVTFALEIKRGSVWRWLLLYIEVCLFRKKTSFEEHTKNGDQSDWDFLRFIWYFTKYNRIAKGFFWRTK